MGASSGSGSPAPTGRRAQRAGQAQYKGSQGTAGQPLRKQQAGGGQSNLPTHPPHTATYPPHPSRASTTHRQEQRVLLLPLLSLGGGEEGQARGPP